MTRTYVRVPIDLIYFDEISTQVFRTALKLNALLKEDDTSIEVDLDSLVNITERSLSTIYQHLSFLRSHGILFWHPTVPGKMILNFEQFGNWACDYPEKEMETEGTDQNEKPQETAYEDGETSDENDPLENQHHPIDSVEGSAYIDESQTVPHKLCEVDLEPQNEASPALRDAGEQTASLKHTHLIHPYTVNVLIKRGIQHSRVSESVFSKDPVRIYHQLAGIKPNQVQRGEIARKVSDSELWRRSVEHWMLHRWNPVNLPGIMELYRRGGPEACKYCHGEAPRPMDNVLEEVRREVDHGVAG